MIHDDEPQSTRCVFTISHERTQLFEMADPGDRIELVERDQHGHFTGRTISARVLRVVLGVGAAAH